MSEELKEKMHDIIFESDTRSGKLFDVVLMILIVLSVITVMLETVYLKNGNIKSVFIILEWGFTIIFTIEYFLRIWVVKQPSKYITSFFGIIDLLAILPTYISLFIIGTQYFMVIRILRLLRMFRILKLGSYITHGNTIIRSLKESIPKITVFLYFIILMVIIFGSTMYFIEGDKNPNFDSIPRSIYWAIITITTVGYGDIAPITAPGQFLAAIVMITGYAVIAVPTGIISANFIAKSQVNETQLNTHHCKNCCHENHENDAKYCKKCGQKLSE